MTAVKTSDSLESRKLFDMGNTIAKRRGPQQRNCAELPQDLSESLRDFKEHTAGLSNRLPLASLEAMRAGSVASPHTLVRRYLVAAKTIGLPKAWAQRFAVWVQRQVDALWEADRTATSVLELKAQECEHIDNVAEKRLDIATATDRAKRLAELPARIATLEAEIAADQLLVAKYQQELREAQH